ncbi:WD40 repeat domain-containing protein, partial [Ferruginibacter sp.]|uniref:WD40 repeat domain-containing protein n=1 Tax=Ferruginibacter sp. TaxID=1940288 RepID=UPI001988072A
MWDTKTGRQLYTFPLDYANYTDGYTGMDISPDGSKIAISSGGLLFYFNTKTGKKIAGGEGAYGIDDLKFSADGNYIYAIRGNGIHILDANTLVEKGSIKDNFSGYSGRIWLLADNKVLVIGDSYPTTSFKVYDIDTKQKISSLDLPKEKNFRRFIFLPKQNMLAVFGSNPGVGLVFYDIVTNTMKGSIPYNGDLTYAAIIPSQNTDEILISGEPDVKGSAFSSNLLNLYSTTSLKKINTFNNTTIDENHPVNGGYFDGFKKELWVQIGGKEVGNYNFASKKYTVFLDGIIAEMSSKFYTTIYNNVNGYLHLTTDKENFKIIDLTRMKPLLHKDLKIFPDAVATTFTGDTIAVFNNSTVTVKNIVTGKIIKSFTGLGMAEGISLFPNNFFFSNDDKFLFYCDDNINSNINKGAINIIRMNLITGIKQKFINAKGFGFTTVHPDKTIMAGFEKGYQFNTAVVWDLITGKRIFSKEVKSSFIQISFDKKKIIMDENISLYNIYDIQTKQITSSIIVPDDLVYSEHAVNKDFSLLARGRPNGYISMYDAKKGKELYSIHAHISEIDKIFFSPDEKLFYSIGSYDNSIKAWETATGRFIGTLYLFRGSTDYVFMDADGRFDGTPEGVKKIYYVINQKPMPLDRIFEKYYTPNLYARSVAGEKFDKIDVIIKPFPKAKISYAEAKRNLEVEEDGIPVYKNTTGFAD